MQLIGLLIMDTKYLKKSFLFGIIRKNLKPIKEYKMKVTLEQVRDNLAKLTIEVSKEEFAIALDKAFEKVVKEVKIDGFRPGKCPKSMFIKRFGYESLYEEAVNFALNETYPKAVDENKLFVVNQPNIDIDFNTLDKDNPRSAGGTFPGAAGGGRHPYGSGAYHRRNALA